MLEILGLSRMMGKVIFIPLLPQMELEPSWFLAPDKQCTAQMEE
jgi:hypothetical protein